MMDAEIVGRMIANIGRAAFEAAFFELSRRTLDVSSCSAFSFEESQTPCSIVLEGLGSEQRMLAKKLGRNYVSEGFRNDPQLSHLFAVNDIEVRVVDPAAIGNDAFRGQYYDQPRIRSEIAVLACYGRKHYNIGFYRSADRPQFDAEAVERTRELIHVALPALHRHLELLLADPDREELPAAAGRPTQQTHDHLSAVLLAEGHGLSPREAQVCSAIILGYRTLAISLNLGISENTICTHRKRAYAKLGISSQNELFSRYFRTVNRLGSGVPQEQMQLAS